MINIKSSGLLSSSSLINTNVPCWFAGIEIVTDGTNPATATVYDEIGASGTELFKGTVAGASNFDSITFEHPVRVDNGIYVELSGTGASYIVYYVD